MVGRPSAVDWLVPDRLPRPGVFVVPGSGGWHRSTCSQHIDAELPGDGDACKCLCASVSGYIPARCRGVAHAGVTGHCFPTRPRATNRKRRRHRRLHSVEEVPVGAVHRALREGCCWPFRKFGVCRGRCAFATRGSSCVHGYAHYNEWRHAVYTSGCPNAFSTTVAVTEVEPHERATAATTFCRTVRPAIVGAQFFWRGQRQ